MENETIGRWIAAARATTGDKFWPIVDMKDVNQARGQPLAPLQARS